MGVPFHERMIMRILDPTTKTPLPATVPVRDEDGSDLVVNERGRMKGILITESDIRRAWRAALDARLDDATGTARRQFDLGLPANDVSLFFVHENGVVQQRIPDDHGDGAPLSRGSSPMLGPDDLGAFLWHARTGTGYAQRERSESFEDHYRLATLFWGGLSVQERRHLVLCARHELGKLENKDAWQRAIAQFRRVDVDLARRVARGLTIPGGAATGVFPGSRRDPPGCAP